MSMPSNREGMGTVSALETWIGIAHVKPRPGNQMLGHACGAMVPILALACSQDDFTRKAAKKLDSYDFDVVEIKDIGQFGSRFRGCGVSRAMEALADSLSEDNPVALHTFQSYTEE